MKDPQKLLSKVRRYVESNSMLSDARGVIVGVSGGPDSMALLDMLRRIRESSGKGNAVLDIAIHVAHLDHGLRRDSSADADFVRAAAEAAGMPYTIGTRDVGAEARATRRGIEETARNLRYAFFAELADSLGIDRIATGHTMNDQAETFLMRLIRGAGGRGLSAMRAVAPLPITSSRQTSRPKLEEGGTVQEAGLSPRSLMVIRPLLCLSRDEVEQYCKDRKLAFRIDPTNLERDYFRNRVRNDLLPMLVRLNPQAISTISRTAEIISAEQDALDDLASSSLGSAVRELLPGERARWKYSAAALWDAPRAVRRRMIIKAIELASSLRPRAATQTTGAHVEAVERLLSSEVSGKRVEIGDGLAVWREFDEIVFMSQPSSPEICVNEQTLDFGLGQDSASFGGLILSVERFQPGSLFKQRLRDAKVRAQSTGRDWMIALLDDARLPHLLMVRARRPGEQAHVLGHRGIKKLKKLMIDHRIPSSRRTNWPVVTTSDGQFIWSPGLPPAIEFAAREDNERFAVLTAID